MVEAVLIKIINIIFKITLQSFAFHSNIFIKNIKNIKDIKYDIIILYHKYSNIRKH